VRKRSGWVAWAMLAIFVAGMTLAVVLMVFNRGFARSHDDLALQLAFTAFMVVGALIVAHRPANAIGWVFSAIGLLTMAGTLALEYTQYAYVTRPGALPGAILAAWVWAWGAFPVFGLTFTFTLLLFPTGRLLSPAWRPIAWLAALTITVETVLAAFGPSLMVGYEKHVIPNPIGITGLPDPEQGAVGAVLISLLLLSASAGCLSLVIRFRRAQGEERQQLKWFAYGAVVMVVSVLIGGLFVPAGSNLGAGLVIALLPVAAGIAILRYRLYDIDRLINRTLVYGLLTALLAGVYASVVLVLGQVFGGVGKDPPSWAVAGATLAVAALFQPARRRIQQVVDRRYNRRQYNATKTVEAFSLRLRDEVDLDTLSAELLAVANQTMQPTTASLWLRPAQARPNSPRQAR
jgi:MFS family permease